MIKYVLTTVLIASFISVGICQDFGKDKTDSIRYNNMKKALVSAEGKAKVDLLNSISEMTELIGARWDTVLMHRKYDTIKFYGSKAYELANKIGYKDGIAMALINLFQHGSPESISQAPLKDRTIREENIRKAIVIGEQSKNYEILGKAYSALGTLQTPFEPVEQSLDGSNKAEYYFQLAKDTEALANFYTWGATDYAGEGNYERAFEYAEKGIEYLKNENVKFVNWHQFLVGVSLETMAGLYTSIGDYDIAMNYLKEAEKHSLEKGPGWHMDNEIAGLFCEMKQYDSALHYWKRWRNGPDFEASAGGSKASGYAILAKICLANKEYDSALNIHRMDIEWFKPFNNKYGIAREWVLMGDVYNKKGNFDSALLYEKKGLTVMETHNDRPLMMKSYQVLSSIYHHLHNNDSAYEYLMKHYVIKDSIDNRQFFLRLYKQKLDAKTQQTKTQLSLLDKDNKLKTEELKQESQQKNFLFILLAAFLLAGIFVYRAISLKRKNERLRLENALTVQGLQHEKKQVELKREASDLQMQALRAQMNPHFIFNSLSSINWFIMENDKDKASDYLTRFSRLMRMVLNAQEPMIPLEDELKMLELYLDLERLRFDNAFDYSITFNNAADAGTVSIPPMLLQPFCENAIWHGFRNKEGHGHINVNIRAEEYLLECTITDNGIGRKQAETFKSKLPKKEKSLGLQITRQRLSLFSEENNATVNFEIEDLAGENGVSAGTKVILTIAYQKANEVAA
ncbi:MAG: hypothetical protein JWM28_3709 [Chitinophagaceae bacterium]|nr:hypothetical protein [Chitinophagaceae bacterium]